jgi:hypothetical protein
MAVALIARRPVGRRGLLSAGDVVIGMRAVNGRGAVVDRALVGCVARWCPDGRQAWCVAAAGVVVVGDDAVVV